MTMTTMDDRNIDHDIDDEDDSTMAHKTTIEPIYMLYDERMLLHRPVNWVEPDVFPEYIDEINNNANDRDYQEDYPVENPERLRVIYERLCNLETRLQDSLALTGGSNGDYGTGKHQQMDVPSSTSDAADARDTAGDVAAPFSVFKRLSCEMATKEQVLLAHREEYYERLEKTQREYVTDEELVTLTRDYGRNFDVYFNSETFQAARLAAGGLLACVDAVCGGNDVHDDDRHDKNLGRGSNTCWDGSSNNNNAPRPSPRRRRRTNKSIALVRPPGHHACQAQEMGFCFINSVVIAAKYALATKGSHVKKVAILDWDIHDGNGTSELTINDPNIFRIDVHRYNRREGFYPYTGPPNEVGTGQARGLNLNMAWSQGGMRNTEYAAAFYELILPLLVAYKPDMLIISCGLDAAMGDLLGGCELTPGFFHAMTRATIEAVGPDTPIVCALEGGYSMHVIQNCMEAVTLAMLNCPYSYHSSSTSYCGGSAVERPEGPRWPLDPLGRARKTLSKYYIRQASHLLIHSAVDDINTSIKIFKSLERWMNVCLRPIVPPNKLKSHHKSHEKKKRKLGCGQTDSSNMNGRSSQRPRMYLWWGSEDWHSSQSRFAVN